jgi:hypothetical protein
MWEVLSRIADVADIVTAIIGILILWQWIVDRSRPKTIDSVEAAFEVALDEHGSPFKEDKFHMGPIVWIAKKLRRWEKEEGPKVEDARRLAWRFDR